MLPNSKLHFFPVAMDAIFVPQLLLASNKGDIFSVFFFFSPGCSPLFMNLFSWGIFLVLGRKTDCIVHVWCRWIWALKCLLHSIGSNAYEIFKVMVDFFFISACCLSLRWSTCVSATVFALFS